MKIRTAIHRFRRLLNQARGRDLKLKREIECPRKYLGSAYGGYCLCPTGIDSNSIVYSIGIGKDISFDLELIDVFGPTVCAFDPTEEVLNWIRAMDIPERLRVFDFGVAHFDGTAEFYPPLNPDHVSYTIVERPTRTRIPVVANVRRISSIMHELGHRSLDLLKLDIEGAEYEVIKDLVDSDIKVCQLLVEFHYFQDLRQLPKAKKTVEILHSKGFRIFDISPLGYVFSFINTRLNE